MASDTLQGKVEPRLAISLTRTEALALYDCLRTQPIYDAFVAGGAPNLGALYKDMEAMIWRRGWCARNGARNSEVRDVPHDRSTESPAN